MQAQRGELVALTPKVLLGVETRRLRESANLSLAQVARIASCDKTYLSRVERAEKFPSELFIAAIDKALGANGLLNRLWLAARNSTFADYVQRYLELEVRASAMYKYMAQTMPGILQIGDYTRAITRAGLPRRDEEAIEEFVVARLSRQQLIEQQDAPLLWTVLDEAVLRRPIGGRRVMAAQLEHAIELAYRPNVIFQVLPFEVGEHGSLGGSLTVLTFSDNPSVAYRENSHTGELDESRVAVDECSLRYDLIRAQALSPKASLEFMEKALEEYR
ncbi:helix-turn-helix domain-containing protein [Streptomyces millisiae]|uniref:Helix-turn-helix transcriptional regulator n=1 Tax=Streptomyces millisiae TaxID=3075542 RepID=A0ABU2LSN6_9ACTN|nr:helix-turn-helix transcriptional regulator [Streptomyces sp. DSM 44918]MDT0320217.1 helix-turn-helix transcriptional regulator [Streptomyces sp. DSM 44918]